MIKKSQGFINFFPRFILASLQIKKEFWYLSTYFENDEQELFAAKFIVLYFGSHMAFWSDIIMLIKSFI